MNPSRAIRCLRLQRLLLTNDRYDAKKLAKKLGVTERTVFRDLQFIEEATKEPSSLVRRRRKQTIS